MSIAQRLDAEWDHLTAKLHRQATAPSASSQRGEQAMTTPQPQRNIFASIATALSEVAGNPLMVRLASERLGELLEPDDIEHIAGLIRKLEQPHLQAAANVPQYTPHDSGAVTQFPAAEQHQQ